IVSAVCMACRKRSVTSMQPGGPPRRVSIRVQGRIFLLRYLLEHDARFLSLVDGARLDAADRAHQSPAVDSGTVDAEPDLRRLSQRRAVLPWSRGRHTTDWHLLSRCARPGTGRPLWRRIVWQEIRSGISVGEQLDRASTRARDDGARRGAVAFGAGLQ